MTVYLFMTRLISFGTNDQMKSRTFSSINDVLVVKLYKAT
jgi:hypothetical protein